MIKTMHKAYAEVYEILKCMPKEYLEKIPMKFMRMFEDCSLANYKILIDPNKTLKEQNVTYEAKVVMSVLKYNYWLSPEEKITMQENLKQNEMNSKKKFDLYDLSERIKSQSAKPSKNVEISQSSESNLPVKVENKFWFAKIIDKIKKFFSK